jgi:alpha-glucosidase (family GH31 glycosyl hydrolase)
MYYDFPESDMAYANTEHGDFSQYMFGDDIVAAPVVREINTTTQMANVQSVWGCL